MSKIIQIVSYEVVSLTRIEKKLIALCDDGSLWEANVNHSDLNEDENIITEWRRRLTPE